jgi:hypothetical protein
MWRGGVGGTQWCVVTEPPWCHRTLARAHDHGPSWAAGKRALSLKLSLNFKIKTKFVIQISDLPDVQNSPNFVVR